MNEGNIHAPIIEFVYVVNLIFWTKSISICITDNITSLCNQDILLYNNRTKITDDIGMNFMIFAN